MATDSKYCDSFNRVIICFPVVPLAPATITPSIYLIFPLINTLNQLFKRYGKIVDLNDSQ